LQRSKWAAPARRSVRLSLTRCTLHIVSAIQVRRGSLVKNGQCPQLAKRAGVTHWQQLLAVAWAMKRDVDYFIDSCSTCQRLSQVTGRCPACPIRSPPVFQWRRSPLIHFSLSAQHLHHRDGLFLPATSSSFSYRLHCRAAARAIVDHFGSFGLRMLSDNGSRMPIGSWTAGRYVNVLTKELCVQP
jgi:hypothetical protein